MVSDQQLNTALGQLDSVIDDVTSHIQDFTKSPNDFIRNRKLNAATTIKVTLNMQGNSLNTELIDAFPNLDDRMTASAYEQQKAKLTPDVFKYIFDAYNKTLLQPHTTQGYRVFAIDGSDFNPPYQNKSAFVMNTASGRPRKDGEPIKPFSQIHANMLYDLENRTYQDCVLQPKSQSNEREAAIDMLKNLDVGKFIVLMDRGYDGFNMIENCNRIEGCNYVIRTKAGHGGIKEITNLPDKECDIEMDFKVTTSKRYYITYKDTETIHLVNSPKRHYKKYFSPNTKNQRWDFEQFCHVKCRVVKFRINNPDTGKEEWEVLLTNLNRFEFPLRKMKDLYHKRWDIETSFRELKYALGGVQFHSRKDDFVLMELYAHFIMFNAVSRNIMCVSVPQQNDNKHTYAISFKEACTITRKYYRLHNNEPPDRIYAEILAYTVPVREGRSDKRNMKPKSAVWFVYRIA